MKDFFDKNLDELDKSETLDVQEVIDLDGAFENVIALFNQFQNVIGEKEKKLNRMIESKSVEIVTLKHKNRDLIASLSEVTIVPDEHVFSVHIKMLRQKTSELLEEAIVFRNYSDELTAKYNLQK